MVAINIQASNGINNNQLRRIINMETKVYSNDVEKALKVFKRQLQKEGLFREIRRRKFYEKPSEKKKRKQREAKQKRAKARKFSRRNDN